MKKKVAVTALVIVAIVVCGLTMTGLQMTREEKFAAWNGCLGNYKRGAEIIRGLSTRNPEDKRKSDIAAYRGERVAFVGVSPTDADQPVGPNDLMTDRDVKLRVVNKKGKDLRPICVWCEVLVCGEVLDVIPEKKTIVIEVDEEDWIVMQTG